MDLLCCSSIILDVGFFFNAFLSLHETPAFEIEIRTVNTGTSAEYWREKTKENNL